ncbi:MAG: protein translocase subunit SecF [Clostridia bacterium]|nr:protein translocase subunit SecF [Clostridia bacterium]
MNEARFHFPFMRWRKYWIALSTVLLVVTVAALIVNTATLGMPLNFGIDFTGGTLVDVKFGKPAALADIRATYEAHGVRDIVVQAFESSGNREFKLTTPAISEDEEVKILEELGKKFGGYELVSKDKVSPVIGSELRRDAILAVGLATVAMIVYLTIRFEIRFAIAAIAAMLHDILLTVGTFAVFRLPVDTSFVVAVLTVYGYSVNDTIIIFDRIRERLHARRKEPLEELINVSINQTLSRTINTVVTVLLALFAVLIFGGSSIHVLALALIVGIVLGTYSSIFVASPVYLYLVQRSERRAQARIARAS